MQHPWIVSVGCMFFCIAASAQQPARRVILDYCDKQVTVHDPSIVSRKVVHNVTNACKDGAPVRVVMVDTRYGFEVPTKTLQGVASSSFKIVEPSPDETYVGFKFCPLTYFQADGMLPEGVMIEWGIKETDKCDGRPSSIYRVYTPQNEVCLQTGPSRTCVHVSKLAPLAQERFYATIYNAYRTELALK